MITYDQLSLQMAIQQLMISGGRLFNYHIINLILSKELSRNQKFLSMMRLLQLLSILKHYENRTKRVD